MRSSLPAKAPAASSWPAGFSSLPKAPLLTALQIQFRGVENLIRALDGLTWAPAVRRRRRR